MLTDLDDVRMVAHGAILLAGGVGVTLTAAILGAAVEAAFPGMGTQAWAELGSWPSLALSVLWLAGMLALIIIQDMAVTYLHTYRSDQVAGRRYRGFGRLVQPAGRHRQVSA
jgi:hypothetical protein